MVVSGSLPFTVDSEFFAAGYEGDIPNIVGTSDKTGAACGGRAVTGAAGGCYKFVYTVPAPTKGFAGVEWQANPGTIGYNFGTASGVVPPPGATEASFYAKGAVGGEVVSFFVGATGTAPCTDSVVTPASRVTLTTTWTRYTLPFAGQPYTAGQVVGFAWTTSAPVGADAGTATTFYIDDIVWDADTDM